LRVSLFVFAGAGFDIQMRTPKWTRDPDKR